MYASYATQNHPIQKKDKDTKLNFTLFTPLVNLPRLFRLFSLIPGSFRE